MGALDVLDLALLVDRVGHLVVDKEVGRASSLHPSLEEGLVLIGENSLQSTG